MSNFLESSEGQAWLQQSIEQLMRGEPVTIQAGPRRAGIKLCEFWLEVDVAFSEVPDDGYEVTQARIRGRLPKRLIRQDQAIARETARRLLEELAPAAQRQEQAEKDADAAQAAWDQHQASRH